MRMPSSVEWTIAHQYYDLLCTTKSVFMPREDKVPSLYKLSLQSFMNFIKENSLELDAYYSTCQERIKLFHENTSNYAAADVLKEFERRLRGESISPQFWFAVRTVFNLFFTSGMESFSHYGNLPYDRYCEHFPFKTILWPLNFRLVLTHMISYGSKLKDLRLGNCEFDLRLFESALKKMPLLEVLSIHVIGRFDNEQDDDLEINIFSRMSKKEAVERQEKSNDLLKIIGANCENLRCFYYKCKGAHFLPQYLLFNSDLLNNSRVLNPCSQTLESVQIFVHPRETIAYILTLLTNCPNLKFFGEVLRSDKVLLHFEAAQRAKGLPNSVTRLTSLDFCNVMGENILRIKEMCPELQHVTVVNPIESESLSLAFANSFTNLVSLTHIINNSGETSNGLLHHLGKNLKELKIIAIPQLGYHIDLTEVPDLCPKLRKLTLEGFVQCTPTTPFSQLEFLALKLYKNIDKEILVSLLKNIPVVKGMTLDVKSNGAGCQLIYASKQRLVLPTMKILYISSCCNKVVQSFVNCCPNLEQLHHERNSVYFHFQPNSF